MKIECAMWNEQINDLAINHSLAPLPEQEWMWALNVEEMESSSKIDLRDVLWWMSIKYTYGHGVLIVVRLSKEGCISLTTRGKPSRVTHKHDWSKCGSPFNMRNIFFQNRFIENTTNTNPLEPKFVEKHMGHNPP